MDSILEIKNLDKYAGFCPILQRISFEVQRGEIFGILGKEQSGKTPLLRILVGLSNMTAGEIKYTFEDSPSFTFNQGAREIVCKLLGKIGYLPENFQLDPWGEVLATLVYYGALRGKPVEEVKKSATIWLKQMGMEAFIGKRIKYLSSGDQQKLKFLVAVAHAPEFVILDEPFAGNDVANQMIIKAIRELAIQGKTVLVASGNFPMMGEVCDQVLMLSRGKELLKNTIGDILENEPVKKVILRYKSDSIEPSTLANLLRNMIIEKNVAGEVQGRLTLETTPGKFVNKIPQSAQILELSLIPLSLEEIYDRRRED